MTPRPALLRTLAALGLFALASCGGSGADASTSDGSADAFLAFSDDFRGFRQWTSFHLADGQLQGSVHLGGPRTDYVNELPPHGSHEFPVGTIIVKELEVGDVPERIVFALVKRGGDYDSAAARGWEWFELRNAADGQAVQIVWRGVGPPIGETYGGDPTGCSGCHAAARDNDFVRSDALQLSRF